MREIKFRAWDKKRKEMLLAGDYPQDEEVMNLMDIDWEGLGILFDGDIIACDECGRFAYLANDRYVLMQYTGLKDKNGKEIWEGDIVKGIRGIGGECVFICGRFSIRYKDGTHLTFISENKNDVEVIGNIYENPELLAAK